MTRFVEVLQFLHDITPLVDGHGGVNAQEVAELIPTRLLVDVGNLESLGKKLFRAKIHTP